MPDENLQGMRYAGFVDRAAAFVMDGIIVGILYCCLFETATNTGEYTGPFLFAGTAVAFNEPGMPVAFGRAVAGIILLLLMSWLYSAMTTSSHYGGTFGKILMGMKVVNTSGDLISFRHATVRFIAKIFSGIIIFIGFFMIHFSKTNQGLHDRFAGTYVIYAKKVAPASPGGDPAVVRNKN
ncbi:MAG: RDD family protein [Methanoregula sp.]|jgi:uncharacterized RDD family membrane protein YckC|nr:RDD family protein [Methanoregula sp.]